MGKRQSEKSRATASDICDAAPTVTSDAPATFPLGTTTVTFMAIDASGNKSTATTTVTVVDTTKPTITTSLLTPATLWPVNHNMIAVGTISVKDICDVKPGVVLNITQDEPLNTTGDGNFSPDASATFSGNTASISLRAERSGNSDGRVYPLEVHDNGRVGEHGLLVLGGNGVEVAEQRGPDVCS